MNPLILQKLQAFAARRRRLIILRGICTALAMLLATMMVVALLDRLFQMPDWLRWVLSGVAYTAVLVAEWRACLRLLLHMPGPRLLARLVEETAPELREDLLSAVELGDGDGRFDSTVFRELLQSSVAERVSTLDAQHLLPVQLLRRSFLILGAVLLVLLGAFFFSGLGFGTMLLRAMLPMANLERLSTIKVHILDPNPADMVVPQGDSVPLDVQIFGGKVEKAYLETFSKAGGRNVVQLSPHGQAGDRFAGGVQIAREDVDYRVRAGDGRSIWYRLHAAARPHVVAFHKTYTYPAYTELPPKTLEETSGDLVAIEGTEVDLRIDTDQPVKTAELRTETGKSNLVVPLEKGADGLLHAKLQLASSGLYHVHLVAAQSGFENKFSPEYELRAEPDLIPRVELELPEQDLIAATSQTIEFSGIATDDLAVSGVEQVYKVNDKPWQKIVLPVTAGAKVRVRQLWDLSQEHLRAGDQVTAKLVASDRKGNRGESRPVQITLVESGFDPRRAEDLAEQAKLLQELIALRNSAVALVKRCDDARQAKDKGPAEEAKFAEAWRGVGDALDDYDAKESGVATQLVKTLPKVEPGSEAGVLVMLGRRLARSDSGAGWLRALHRSVLDPAVGPVRGDFVNQAGDTAHRMESYARTLEEACRKQVATVELGVISENLQVLWRDQKQLAEQASHTRPEDAPAWFKLASHYRVALAEAVQIEDALITATSHVPQHRDHFKQLVKRLQAHRAELGKVIAVEHPDNQLQGPANNYATAVSEMLNQLLEATRESLQQGTNSYEQMRREVAPAYTFFDRVRWEVEEPQKNDRVPPGIRTYQSESRWDERTAMWKKYGDWEEVRPDADNYFVQQLRQLSLALPRYRETATSLGKSKERDDVYKELIALQMNFRVLECVHDLTEVATGLDALAAQERWESASLRARTAGPTAWAWLDNRLRLAPEEIGHIDQRDDAARKAVNEAQQVLRRAHDEQDGRDLQQEMQQRMNKERRPIAQERPTRAVAAQVREAIRLLQPFQEKAEQALAAVTPKLPEKLAELAKEAAELKQKSEERAAATPSESNDTAKAETRQELAQQQKLNAEVDAVKDAIRNDAQRQNLLQEQGRERARDADDALGMLREPPPRAAQALADAAAGEKAEERKDALQSAAAEQQKLATALEQLAKHYDALEQGKADDTRMALREAEKALGLKPNLDRQFAQSEQLAKAAEGSPEEMLKQLEKALPQNPVMRQELSGVAKNTLQTASEKLAMATHEEQKIAKSVSDLATEQAKQTPPPAEAPKPGENTPANQPPQNNPSTPTPQNTAANPPPAAPNPPAPGEAPKSTPPTDATAAQQPPAATPPAPAAPTPAAPPPNPMLAQAATQQPAIAQNTKQAGEEVERAGRHEERLKHQQNGEQLQRLGREVQATGEHEVPQAKEALEKAQAAAQAQTPVTQASAKLDRDLNRLNNAANGMPDAPAADASTPAPAPADAQNKPAGDATPATAAATPKGDAAAPPNAATPAPGEAAKPGDPAAMAAASGAPSAPPAGAPPAPGEAPAPGENGSPIPPAGTAATPQQQVWMARALDSLDAALHAQNTPPQSGAEQGQPSPGQPKPGQSEQPGSQPGSQPGQSLAEAKQAMNAAAQAAAAAMRAQRSEAASKQHAETAQSELAESLEGSDVNGPMTGSGALPKAQLSRNGDWGKLPKQMAEQLSQGQREGVSSEYRNQVETYYRVIAERAKKP